MKKRLSILAAILLFGLNSVLLLAQKTAADNDRMVGAWKLLKLEQPGPNGQMSSIDCCGMFVFTATGHLSVQVMDRGAQSRTQTAGSEQYSQGGYEASYGNYVVNPQEHTFTFHVEGALVRDLIGKDLQRRYEFRGDQLIVQSTRPDEHWRVIWGRY